MATSTAGLNFDGTNDYLDTNDNTNFDFTATDFTMVCWFNTDTTTGEHSIVSNATGGGSSAGWRFDLNGDELSHTRPNVGAFTTTGLNFTTDTWYACAVAYEQSGQTFDAYKITQQGVVTSDLGTSSTDVTASGSDLWIGDTLDGRRWNGDLRYIQIFSKQLSLSEVLCAVFSPGSHSVNLTAYWPINGAADPETDLGTIGADAALTNAPSTTTDACPGAIPLQMPIM